MTEAAATTPSHVERAVLDNPRSDRVKTVARLAAAAGRRRAGQFMVEGPHAVGELLSAVSGDHLAWDVRVVYATGEPAAATVAQVARGIGVPTTTVTPEVLRAMSNAATPQGVVAVVALPQSYDDAITPGSTVAQWSTSGFGALLVEVRDPGNVGTIIRAADAAGAGFVALSRASADPYAPKAVRSSAGSLFHVPVAVSTDAVSTAEAARRHGWRVLATAADGPVSLDDLSSPGAGGLLADPHLWLLGNEAHGVPASMLEQADAVVRIPIRGRAESLNLAMAATLVLFASARAQRNVTQPPHRPHELG